MTKRRTAEPELPAILDPGLDTLADLDTVLQPYLQEFDKALEELEKLEISDKEFEELELDLSELDLTELDSLDLTADFTELEEELSKLSEIDLSDFENFLDTTPTLE